MENEQVFEAEVDIDALMKLQSRSSRQSLRPSRDAPESAKKDSHGQDVTQSEHTPLLAHESPPDSADVAQGQAGADDPRGPPKWSGERDFEGLPWWRTPSIYWLLPPFALFALSFGGIIVPKLNLILSLICEEYFSEQTSHDPSFHMMPITPFSDNPQCRVPEVSALVSKFMLYSNLIAGVFSAIISPKMGEISDRYGRIPMLCITSLGLLCNEAITIIVAKNPGVFSVNWILLGSFFDGISGSFIAAMSLSYAYASDCTPPSRRSMVFGYYMGCLFGGIALGPIFAGYIVKLTGNILTVFYIAVATHCAFFVFLILIIPESLSKERQYATREKKRIADENRLRTKRQGWGAWLESITYTATGGELLAPLKILWPTGPGTNPAIRRNLFFLAASDMTIFGVAMGAITVILLYSEFMFGWDTFETSLFVSIINVGRVSVLVIILPLLSRLVRGPQSKSEQRASGSDNFDLYIIRTSIFFDLLGYIGYATVRTGPLFTLSGVVASFGGMGSPTISAALTKHLPPDKTGQVLGAMGLLHSIARVVSPNIFNLIYAKTVGTFPQAVFVCLTAAFGLAFVFSWFIRPHVYWDEPMDGTSEGILSTERDSV